MNRFAVTSAALVLGLFLSGCSQTNFGQIQMETHNRQRAEAKAAVEYQKQAPQRATAGGDTGILSADQRAVIGNHVRECWTKEPGVLDADKQRVLLTVITDAGGVARIAEVIGQDLSHMGDPSFRIFTERARSAVLDPCCANLPLSRSALGKVNTLTFRLTP